MKTRVNIAILASGQGSNADKICSYFAGRKDAVVSVIITNKPGAGVLGVAKDHGIAAVQINNEKLPRELLATLESHQTDFVVLAGFLRIIPQNVVEKYGGRMVNIHPALLPKHGGKGMYGMRVHEAVVTSKEIESGITIHHVNSEYDKGDIIFQAKCAVEPSDTPETLAQKIHTLEHKHFPEVIHKLIQKSF